MSTVGSTVAVTIETLPCLASAGLSHATPRKITENNWTDTYRTTRGT